ncbi:hypothetical protein D3C72_2453520 [compost metagenome]
MAIKLGEPGDVLGNTAAQQFDVLRQVTNRRAKGLAVPAVEVGAIQPDGSGQGRPDTYQHLGQGRLAGTGRPQHT